jgi:hypothetical protein
LEDPYLRHKLSAVKADIISWALAMPKVERDAILLQPSKNQRIRLAKLDAATYGDPVRSFIDLCFRPTDDASPIQNHELHSWFIAYCKAHGYSDNRGMSKFISHLKTVIPQHHVPRHRQDGELQPACWAHLTLIPGVMVDVSLTEDASNGYQGKPQLAPEPEWRCAKFRCKEGGLLAFDEWQEQNISKALAPEFDLNSNESVNRQEIEGVRVFPSPQHSPHQTGEKLDSALNTRIYPTQTHTQPEIDGALGASRCTPISCNRPDRSPAIDEWVSQLSEVANRDGTTYEAVKGLGVPDNLRPEIFVALAPPVKERLKKLREEFKGRIPQDIQKWREAIATWLTVNADALNSQWQQFDLWSQCLLGICNWVERIAASGLFDLAASRYSQAIELASGKSETVVSVELPNADEPANIEPKQLNLLPIFQSLLGSENRFSHESEDWF